MAAPEEELFTFSENVLLTHVESDIGQINYVYLGSDKVSKNFIKICETCKHELLSNEDRKTNEFINAKEYNKNKKWLVYPSTKC